MEDAPQPSWSMLLAEGTRSSATGGDDGDKRGLAGHNCIAGSAVLPRKAVSGAELFGLLELENRGSMLGAGLMATPLISDGDVCPRSEGDSPRLAHSQTSDDRRHQFKVSVMLLRDSCNQCVLAARPQKRRHRPRLQHDRVHRFL